MYRTLTKSLFEWRDNFSSKPLMLLGARQVGKTYLLDKFCANNFGKYHYFNFEETSELENIFNDSINP